MFVYRVRTRARVCVRVWYVLCNVQDKFLSYNTVRNEIQINKLFYALGKPFSFVRFLFVLIQLFSLLNDKCPSTAFK